MTGFYAPRELLARKPPHGSPCTNCGLCCLATLCDLAKAIFDPDGDREGNGPCPALLWTDDGMSRCGITIDEAIPETLRESAKVLIFAGRGCDARFNGERNNTAYTERMNHEDATTNREAISAARAAWGLDSP